MESEDSMLHLKDIYIYMSLLHYKIYYIQITSSTHISSGSELILFSYKHISTPIGLFSMDFEVAPHPIDKIHIYLHYYLHSNKF
jgi:hypothetical protein